MKNKLITIMIIGLLVFSTIDLTLAAAKVECPTCNGTGKIDCPKCDGTGKLSSGEAVECTHCLGSGTLKPKVIKQTVDASVSGGTTVTVTLVNQETVEATGTVTVSLDGQSKTSEKTTFPPDEAVTATLSIPYIGPYTSAQLIQRLKVTVNTDTITCPYCDGEGTTSDSSTTCTKCDGTGTIDCTDCDGTGYVTEGAISTPRGKGTTSSFDWTLIIGVTGAVVAVAAVGGGGFFLLKKRRVSEKSLRRLSSGEFQGWVLKRLDGKPATSKDIAVGIDGFSRLNQPISIKQSDSVGMNAVDLFAASLAKNRATAGMMVAFGFSDDAIRGKVRARTNYRLDIQMMTVRELIENKHPGY
jgi:hypothetical protein